MRFRILFLLLVFPLLLSAQHKKKPGHARFLKTFNYVSLAHELTDSTMTDEQKTRSIFLWMTKHITYGMHIEDPNAILWNRSAVCLGYSILFDSLCKIAGVQSHIVIGYAYEPWAEAGDTLYTDNHAWNAVMIDGEWKLIDVTWSRGSLKLQKDPVRKVICKIFRRPFVPHYKFKRAPNENYYLAPPERFILDHFPSTCAWQLLPCAVPIDSFQRSHYATINYLNNPVNCMNCDDSITPIVNAFQYNQLVVNGYQALHLNPNNHVDISYAMEVAAKYRAIRAEDTLMWWQTRLTYYDTTIKYLDTLVKTYKKLQKDEVLETKFLLRRNKRMNAKTVNETRPMYRKQLTEMTLVKKTRFLIYKQYIKLWRESGKLKFDNRRIRKRKLKLDRPDMLNPAQQNMHDKLEENYLTLMDDVDELRTAMEDASYYQFGWEGPFMDSLAKDKKRWLKVQSNDMNTVNYYRAFGLNSFDTLVYTPKNEVLLAQHYQDSLTLLMRDPGKWRFDSAYLVAKANAVKAKTDLETAMGMLKQMSKLPSGTIDEVAEFKKCKEEYKAINDSLIRFNKERKRELLLYKKQFKRVRLKRILLRWKFHNELQNEKWRYAGYAKFFTLRGRYYDIGIRNEIIETNDLRRAEKSRRKALVRKVRKWEREHKKTHRKRQKQLIKNKELSMSTG